MKHIARRIRRIRSNLSPSQLYANLLCSRFLGDSPSALYAVRDYATGRFVAYYSDRKVAVLLCRLLRRQFDCSLRFRVVEYCHA